MSHGCVILDFVLFKKKQLKTFYEASYTIIVTGKLFSGSVIKKQKNFSQNIFEQKYIPT